MHMRLTVALGTLWSVARADFAVTILATREVRGAVYPVDRWGGQCESNVSQVSADCGCFGGASRRAAYIHEGTSVLGGSEGHNVITLDTGAYFSGSGKFYPAFGGNASAAKFAAANYDTFGLAFRDLSVPGEAGLAAYLALVRSLNPSVSNPVVTNYDTDGDDGARACITLILPNPRSHPRLHEPTREYKCAGPLAGLIEPYRILPLSRGRSMAVLSLTDPTHLRTTAAGFASRLRGYWRSLAVALARLRRLPQVPDVVVVAMSGIPATEGDACATAAASDIEAVRTKLDRLVREAIGVDIWILGFDDGFDLTESGPHIRQNWANDSVLVVPQRSNSMTWGKGIDNITARFSDDGLLLPGLSGASTIELGCRSPEDTIDIADTTTWYEEMNRVMGVGIGQLAVPLDSPLFADDRGVPADGLTADGLVVEEGCATINGTAYCGCRVMACKQGAFIADALAYVAGTQIALFNAGGLRATLPSGVIDRGDLFVLVPFVNAVVRMAISGATLRLALQNSISQLQQAPTAPHGRFAQTSAALKYEYYFREGVPTLSHVYVNGSALNDTEIYTVAMNDYMAGGGDGYSMFAAVRGVESLGVVSTDAAIAYLQHVAPLGGGGLVQGYAERIVQQGDQIVLQISLLCRTTAAGESTTNAGEREECDHMHHFASVLNDKTDGLFDDLLPSARVELVEGNIGCVEQLGPTLMPELMAQQPRMLAAVGVGCSNDVADISSAAYRASTGFRAVVVSGASTSTVLTDDVAYPNVVRLITGEGVGGGPGNAALAASFGWKRIAVVHDDSTWAVSAAAAFAAPLVADGGLVLNDGDEVTQGISVSEWDASPDDDAMPEAVLRQLEALNVRIVYLCVQPRMQERIFAVSYRQQRMHGLGYGWLLGWVSDNALLKCRPEPLGCEVSPDAVRGMEGALGLLESVGEGTDLYRAYNERWLQASAPRGCTQPSPYCDVDGSLTEAPASYSMFMVEAMLTVVRALHLNDNYRDASFLRSPDRLYAAIQQVGSPPGYSGPSGRVVLDEHADRLGNFDIKNMQQQTGRRRLSSKHNTELSDAGGSVAVPLRFRGREMLVPLSETTAGYQLVGSWSPGQAAPTISGVPIKFPGNTRTVPSDTPPANVSVGGVVGVLALVSVSILGLQRYRQRRVVKRQKASLAASKVETDAQRREAEMQKVEAATQRQHAASAQAERDAAKKELDAFKEAITGVKAVIQDFDPCAMLLASTAPAAAPSTDDARTACSCDMVQVSVSSAAADNAAAASATAVKRLPRQFWATYYWLEDAGRIGGHDPSQVLQRDGKHWVRYAHTMSQRLEEAYHQWLAVPAGGAEGASAVVNLDLDGQISSTGTEEKAFAKESGTKFTVDLSRMVQINAKTGFERAVFRVEAPVDAQELEAQAAFLRSELHLSGTPDEVASLAAQQLGVTIDPPRVSTALLLYASYSSLIAATGADGEGNGHGGDANGDAIGDASAGGCLIAAKGADGEGNGHVGDASAGANCSTEQSPRSSIGKLRSLVKATADATEVAKAMLTLPDTGRVRTSPTGMPIVGSGVPDELQGEDLLLLAAGQLLQVSKMRADGWCFGSVMLDTMENRKSPNVAGVSTQAGWFPTANTAIANAEQLGRLQKKMGANAATALAMPSHWGAVKDPMQAEMTLLTSGSKEENDIVAYFRQTLPPTLVVVDVQRIQNVSMWQSYAVKRQTVLAREKDQKSATRFERVWLFHGTDEDTVPKIIQQGFNRAFCGKNATAYGKGVYFARDAAYSSSSTYSRPNAQGVQHMFLCRVVVGEYCRGVRDALTPAVRQGHTLYDSTVDNVGNPGMYITYHDAQAYPEYLVRFKQ